MLCNLVSSSEGYSCLQSQAVGWLVLCSMLARVQPSLQWYGLIIVLWPTSQSRLAWAAEYVAPWLLLESSPCIHCIAILPKAARDTSLGDLPEALAEILVFCNHHLCKRDAMLK